MVYNKAAMGQIGEFEVLSRLLLHEWNACNANVSQLNFKGVDIFCQNPETGQIVGIQVKTSTYKSFPLGITIGEFVDGSWRSKICGPYVFVHLAGSENNPIFRFFILSQHEMLEMIETTHNWYVKEWHREKPLSPHGVMCINLPWLEVNPKIIPSKTDKDGNLKYPSCEIPLTETAENKWHKIWE